MDTIYTTRLTLFDFTARISDIRENDRMNSLKEVLETF